MKPDVAISRYGAKFRLADLGPTNDQAKIRFDAAHYIDDIRRIYVLREDHCAAS